MAFQSENCQHILAVSVCVFVGFFSPIFGRFVWNRHCHLRDTMHSHTYTAFVSLLFGSKRYKKALFYILFPFSGGENFRKVIGKIRAIDPITNNRFPKQLSILPFCYTRHFISTNAREWMCSKVECSLWKCDFIASALSGFSRYFPIFLYFIDIKRGMFRVECANIRKSIFHISYDWVKSSVLMSINGNYTWERRIRL